MDGSKNKKESAATNEVAAETQIPAEAVIAELEGKLKSMSAKCDAIEKEKAALQAAFDKYKADAEKEKADLQAAFDKYKADAQEVLASAKKQIVQSDMPILEFNDQLYVFKMGVFRIGATKYTAKEIIANPLAHSEVIELLISKYKILQPFKAE